MKEKARKVIEESFPELLEIKEGSLILPPHWNVFSQKYDENVFDEYFVKSGVVMSEYEDDFRCNIHELNKHFSDYKVENEITLNCVIMYVQEKGGSVIGSTNYSSLFFGGVVEYDLLKSFEEQSEKFYEFITKL